MKMKILLSLILMGVSGVGNAMSSAPPVYPVANPDGSTTNSDGPLVNSGGYIAKTDLLIENPNSPYTDVDSGTVVNYQGEVWRSRTNTVQYDGLTFVDFDGDSVDNTLEQEVFLRVPETAWYIRQGLESSSLANMVGDDIRPFSNMTFGHFNSDNKSDLFSAGGGKFWVSYAQGDSYGPWQVVATTPEPMSELAFGDFNGDGLTDVFKADSARREWSVSYSNDSGGMSGWSVVKYGVDATIKDLIFGSFRVPGRTDIVQVVPGWGMNLHTGTFGDDWETLTNYDYFLPAADKISCVDLDNNGLTDIYHKFYVYNTVTNTWNFEYNRIFFNGSNYAAHPDQSLLMTDGYMQHHADKGDIDCDGRSDSFRIGID